ncbi:MAG: phasin [Micavibrio aeruginosavorus]|uniref:Phasin n=1 Tax=Micavibrio aeruginosavorus TaxID=349221 RepID=A0A2W5NBI5_9BACT|nr:MAG: phasin [Micavibrio aeruginosavorus]
MQHKNSAEGFFSDAQTTLKQMLNTVPTGYPFDFKTILDAQRKNFQALTEANQRALQGWQAIAARQTEMVSQFVQDNSSLARETFTEGTPESKFAKQTELLKTSYETSVHNAQELVEMAQKCASDAAEVINDRVVATLGEIKATAKKAKASA